MSDSKAFGDVDKDQLAKELFRLSNSSGTALTKPILKSGDPHVKDGFPDYFKLNSLGLLSLKHMPIRISPDSIK